jgi:hypothetical protein
MTTTSSSRRRSSAVVENSTVTSDANAQIADKSTGYLERAREIGEVVSSAMQKLSDIDWKRESPAISETENHLNEVMAQFADGAVSKMDVKAVYKQWVNAHRGLL